MKSFFVAILGMFLLLCSVASCKQAETTSSSISFDTLSVDTICPLFKNYDKPACHIKVHLEYPDETTTTALQTAFRRFVASLPKESGFDSDSNESFEAMSRNYVRNYILEYLSQGPAAIDNYGEDLDAAATWMSYEETVNGQVTYCDHEIVSYEMHVYSYSGGAHGSNECYLGVFDLKSQRELQLYDCFPLSSLSQLNLLIQETLISENECSSIEELEQKGLFFSPAEIEASENFSANDEGMTWVYDPYEIGPFSTGVVTISLPWSSLLPLLHPESPLQALAK